eukprot:GHVN01053243.1.p1 GENE.GHVN01053243.1~~GHVN01053243.1.p1  ORF type:complete len:302 (-),score=118.98 GHVN01053243.1:53-859(-)
MNPFRSRRFSAASHTSPTPISSLTSLTSRTSLTSCTSITPLTSITSLTLVLMIGFVSLMGVISAPWEIEPALSRWHYTPCSSCLQAVQAHNRHLISTTAWHQHRLSPLASRSPPPTSLATLTDCLAGGCVRQPSPNWLTVCCTDCGGWGSEESARCQEECNRFLPLVEGKVSPSSRDHAARLSQCYSMCDKKGNHVSQSCLKGHCFDVNHLGDLDPRGPSEVNEREGLDGEREHLSSPSPHPSPSPQSPHTSPSPHSPPAPLSAHSPT